MLVLNIADIHFNHPLCNTEMDPDLPFRTALINDVRAHVHDLGPVDVILVVGDIAFHGWPQEYDAARAWLTELAKAAICPLSRIHVVPGNHDVDRAVTSRKPSVRNVQLAIKSADPTQRHRVLFEQFQDAETGLALFTPLAAYNEFAAPFDCQVYAQGRLFWQHELPLDDQTVLRMYGLTSTLLSGAEGGDDSRDSLYLSPLQTVLNPVEGVVNLVLCHHPPDWFMDHDDIDDAVRARAGLQFFGHKHRQRIHRDATYVRFSAGAVNPDQQALGWRPGYNIIRLSIEHSDRNSRLAVEAHMLEWQPLPPRFRSMETDEGEKVFGHSIPILGRVKPSSRIPPVAAPEPIAEISPASEPEPVRTELAMSDDPTRNLVFRFWALSSSQRREIALDLGLIDSAEMRLPEPERYRLALLRAKERNLLRAVAEEIEKREAH